MLSVNNLSCNTPELWTWEYTPKMSAYADKHHLCLQTVNIACKNHPFMGGDIEATSWQHYKAFLGVQFRTGVVGRARHKSEYYLRWLW